MVVWTDGWGEEHVSDVLHDFWFQGLRFALICHRGDFRVLNVEVDGIDELVGFTI